MQTITLQFGPVADRLASQFWNAQDSLLRWAQYKDVSIGQSQYFAMMGGKRVPRFVSLMPTEHKEIIGEVEKDGEDLEQVQFYGPASPQELFPHIEINKNSVQRVNVDVHDDVIEPFHHGMLQRFDSEEFMDSVRRFAEECDNLQYIQTFTSDDQYGGCGVRLLDTVVDDYEKKTIAVFSVPSTDLTCSWESKALSLYAHKEYCHVPFALMKPDDLEWSVKSYQPFSIFASAIDTINSQDSIHSLAQIGTIAYGMRMECDATSESVKPVIDLMSFASPVFDSILCSVDRSSVPSYVKMNNHGYIPHHTVATYGISKEFPEYLEDISQNISKSCVIKRVDSELHSDIKSFLLELADK
jgi:hypothetical protein